MIYFIITLFFFSTIEIASKPLMGVIDPFLLTLIRFSLGFLTILAFGLIYGQQKELLKLTIKQIGILAFLGFVNAFFSMSMLQLAVKNTSAATAAVVFCSNPMFALFFSIIYKDEKASFKNFAPVLLGILGTFFVMKDKGLVLDYGVIYALLASIGFGFYYVTGKKTASNMSVFTVNTVSFFFGILALFIFILVSGRGFNADLFSNTGMVTAKLKLSTILYLGVLVSGVGYLTFFKTLKKYSAMSSSYIFLLKPTVATILAIIFLGERVGLNFWAGMLMIVAGGVLVLY
ncbi:MAG: DMT family transporter, partial [bacterium]